LIRPSIVLIEDSKDDAFLVREALAGAAIQHDLTVMEDGADIVSLLDQVGTRPPDLFLIDLNLPRVDGFQVLAAIREHPRCQATPVIVMSSSDSESDHKRAAALSVSGYFCKPLDLDEFMKLGGMVQSALDAQAARVKRGDGPE